MQPLHAPTNPDLGPHAGLHADEATDRLDQEPTVDETRADTLLLLAICDRHRVQQEDLARACNLDRSYISRLQAGRFAVPVVVFRALWDLTGDADLLAYLGSPTRVVVGCPRASTPSHHEAYVAAAGRTQAALLAAHELLYARHTLSPEAASDPADLLHATTQAIAALVELQRHAVLAAHAPDPTPAAAPLATGVNPAASAPAPTRPVRARLPRQGVMA